MFISHEIQRLFCAKFDGYTTKETAFNALSTKKNVFSPSSSSDLLDNGCWYINSDASKHRSMREIWIMHQESAKMENISMESMCFVHYMEHSRNIEKSLNWRNVEYSIQTMIGLKSLNWRNVEYSIQTMIGLKSLNWRNVEYSIQTMIGLKSLNWRNVEYSIQTMIGLKSLNWRNVEYSIQTMIGLKSLNWRNVEYSIQMVIENETQKSLFRRNLKYSRSNGFQCVSLKVWSELPIILNERFYSCIADINIATEACNMTQKIIEGSNSHRKIQLPYLLEFCICHTVSICVQKAEKYIRGASSILIILLKLAMEKSILDNVVESFVIFVTIYYVYLQQKEEKNNAFEPLVYEISNRLKLNGSCQKCVPRNVIYTTQLLVNLLSVILANRSCDRCDRTNHGICDLKQKLSTIRGMWSDNTFIPVLTCDVKRHFVIAGVNSVCSYKQRRSTKMEPLPTVEPFIQLVGLTLTNGGSVNELLWISIAKNKMVDVWMDKAKMEKCDLLCKSCEVL